MPDQRRVAAYLAAGHALLSGFFLLLRYLTPRSQGKGF